MDKRESIKLLAKDFFHKDDLYQSLYNNSVLSQCKVVPESLVTSAYQENLKTPDFDAEDLLCSEYLPNVFETDYQFDASGNVMNIERKIKLNKDATDQPVAIHWTDWNFICEGFPTEIGDEYLKWESSWITGMINTEQGPVSLGEINWNESCTRPPNDQNHNKIKFIKEEGHKGNTEDLIQELDSLLNEVEELDADREELKPSIPFHEKSPIQSSWAIPIDVNKTIHNFKELVPNLAREFPFELDTFQKQAIIHLENSENVFISAHTSAGKTVIAEYAVALSFQHMTKAIYTSPIKALSNQKYRDFKEQFGAEDVGILTGDVQINPNALCLVMTTEILRSMLYKGQDMVQDIEFVIFDEVHYINDYERGVVWEEVLILLPPQTVLILLSATIPNTIEFADWVGRTRKKHIHVISTTKRPVPLEHYLYIGQKAKPSDPMIKIVDAGRNFLSQGYKDAYNALNPTPLSQPASKALPSLVTSSSQKRAPSKPSYSLSSSSHHQLDKHVWIGLLQYLEKKSLLPAVIFSFSKKKCEEYIASLSNVDLLTKAEKSQIQVFFHGAIKGLKGSDQELPQIIRLKESLLRGLAVHHGGLLPLMKETVEILFSKGLVKMLFATETFAMGINMPAKTVVFSSRRKHDDTHFRDLLPGEYTQMSGRAGRRGLDKTGIVIIMTTSELFSESSLKSMILGTPTKLQSQFRLTYNMILQLLRVQSLHISEMIKKSFCENEAQKSLPEQEEILKQDQDQLLTLQRYNALECPICSRPMLERYYENTKKIFNISSTIYDDLCTQQKYRSKLFTPGRIIILKNHSLPGIILTQRQDTSSKFENDWFVLTYKSSGLSFDSEVITSSNIAAFIPENEEPHIICIPTAGILHVTNAKINIDFNIDTKFIDPKDLTQTLDQQKSLLKSTLLSEVEIPKPRELDLDLKLRQKKALMDNMNFFKNLFTCPSFKLHYETFLQEKHLMERISGLKLLLSDENLSLLPEYENRLSFLKKLNYVDETGVVQMKGRIACELNTVDEIVVTELLMENFFKDFTPEEMIALLSMFVFQEKTDGSSDVSPSLSVILKKGKEKIVQTAMEVMQLQFDCHLPEIVAKTPIERLKFGLIEVVYEWARGMPFKQITELTSVLEGTIVRTITRLDETCRDIKNAAKIMGNTDLMLKIEKASLLIKRDICFAASLYL